jgi:hypothetical protein
VLRKIASVVEHELIPNKVTLNSHAFGRQQSWPEPCKAVSSGALTGFTLRKIAIRLSLIGHMCLCRKQSFGSMFIHIMTARKRRSSEL